MASIQPKGRVQQATIRAVVTRANGTVEDLGVISFYHRNPLKRWSWHTKRFFKRLVGKAH